MVVDAAELYLHRSSLEYSLAFDRACSWLAVGDGPLLAVISSPVHAVELLKRWVYPLEIVGSGNFQADEFIYQMQAWRWGPLQSGDLDPKANRYLRFLWAEVEAEHAVEQARALRYLAAPGAQISVITSTWLRRWLPAWQEKPEPAQSPVTSGRVCTILRQAGWKVDSCHGLHGLRAYLWSSLSRLADSIHRPDLADRCLFAMRRVYWERSWLWRMTPLVVIHARAM